MAYSQVAHPLGAPTVSGTTITVETYLKQPTRITNMLMDLSKQQFVSDLIFASGGGVTGGAVIYDQVIENELYTERDAEKIAPGSEFPILTSDRQVPKVAEVEKWGGKVFITTEAVDRNDQVAFANQIRQLNNTIIRKINAIAIATLETELTAYSQTLAGVDWTEVITAGTSATTAQEMPMRDFIAAQGEADIKELGVTYDTFLLNPEDWTNLATIYGANLQTLFSDLKISYFVSNRITAGTMYAVAKQQVGQMLLEQPLATETWYEEATQRTWVQASVRPVHFVTNPFAALKITGIQG